MERTIICRGERIDFSVPKIMGILNFTPDSFYSESRVSLNSKLVSKVKKMLFDGAKFIDIGAYSSRPGASFVNYTEERSRIVPALNFLTREFPDALFSVDTFRSEIVKEVVDSGASIINDISGGQLDKQMFKTIADLKIPYILMHMRGTPQTMMQKTKYNNLISDVITDLESKIETLYDLGHKNIIVDPGLGFAKTLKQNYHIVKDLQLFEQLKHPILVGASRKSMIYKLLDCGPDESLIGTSVVHTACLLNGASILRVHDVKDAVEAVKITTLLKK